MLIYCANLFFSVLYINTELMRKCFMINAPFLFNAAWYVIKGFLSSRFDTMNSMTLISLLLYATTLTCNCELLFFWKFTPFFVCCLFPRTLAKVSLMGGNYMNELLQDIDKAQLPGTCCWYIECCCCVDFATYTMLCVSTGSSISSTRFSPILTIFLFF